MEQLKLLRVQRGLRQIDLAKMLGVDRSTYAKYESGASEPNFETIVALAQFFDVSTDQLLTGTHMTDRAKEKVIIPVLGEVAAGIPIEAIEDIVDYEDISVEMATAGEYFGLRLKGQSMEPRMCDGDVVIVKKQSCAENGDIAVVLVNGDAATVKKIRRNQSGITLIPLNPAFDALFYTNEEIDKLPIAIIGIVVELRAKFH